MKSKIAFVTGAKGFIGRHLVKSLERQGLKVNCLKTDITKPESYSITNNTSYVFHLAAKLSHRQSQSSITEKVNVFGTNELLKKAIQLKNLKQFIYVSTISVYGVTKFPAKETSRKNPATPYEVTKLAAEKLVLEAHKKSGLIYTIVQPCVVFGPGDTASPLTTIYQLIKKKVFLPIGCHPVLLQTIFIDDLINGIMATIDDPAALNQDFIMAGETVSLRQLAKIIANVIKTPLLPGYLPVFLAKLMSNFIYHPHSLYFLLTNRVFSSAKARHLLNFSAKTPLEKSLKQTIKWYQKNLP